MIAKVNSCRTVGVHGVPTLVEVSVESGVGIHLVGLADAAVKESLLRVVTAIRSSGYSLSGGKTVINVAPADLTKGGSQFDLPIALGILSASGQIRVDDLDRWMVLGELGLDGSVRAVPGCVQACVARGMDPLLLGSIIPAGCAAEVADLFDPDGDPIYGVSTLGEVVGFLESGTSILNVWDMARPEKRVVDTEPAWNSFRGNETARRAIEIAAAGGHNVLLIGNDDSHMMVGKALNELLPDLGPKQELEVAEVYSVYGRDVPRSGGRRGRPFRCPHWSLSLAGLLGGGTDVGPGEVSLSHNGTLFIEEAAMMPKAVSEALRGPLDDGCVTITRLRSRVTFPARFRLVLGTPTGPDARGWDAAYLARLNPALLDHVAVQARTDPFEPEEDRVDVEPLERVRDRVLNALKVQWRRYEAEAYDTNDEVPSRDLARYCPLSDKCVELLERLFGELGLSVRSYSRVVRIARTIADLDGSPDIRPCDISEAASFRFLDRSAR